MNKYTLTFLDQRIEEEFEKFQMKQLKELHYVICVYSILLSFVFSILYLSKGEWILCILFFVTALNIILVGQLIKKQIIGEKWIPMLFYSFTIFSSLAPFFIRYLSINYINQIMLTDICSIGVFSFIKTSKFINNMLCYQLFVVTRILRHFQDDMTQLEIGYFLMSIMIIIVDYYNVRAIRLHYLTTKENKTQFNILESFSNEKIMITQFSRERMKFQNILISKSLKEKVECNDCNEIMKAIYLNKSKETFHHYVFTKYISNQDKFFPSKFDLIERLEAKYQKYFSIQVDIQILDQIELKFIIRLSFQQQTVKKDSAALYKSLFNQIKRLNTIPQIDYLVKYHIYANLVSHFALTDQNKLNYNVNKTYLNFQTLADQFHSLKTCQIRSQTRDLIKTDFILLSSIIYLACQIMKVKIIFIEKCSYLTFKISCIGVRKSKDISNNKYFLIALNRIHSLIGSKCLEILDDNQRKLLRFDLLM